MALVRHALVEVRIVPVLLVTNETGDQTCIWTWTGKRRCRVVAVVECVAGRTRGARHRPSTGSCTVDSSPCWNQRGSPSCPSVTRTNRNTSGYTTMVHGRRCNPHRCTTTFANLEITSLWHHWWRHNSETIRDREKRRPPCAMKSSELSNGENRIALWQLLQNRKWQIKKNGDHLAPWNPLSYPTVKTALLYNNFCKTGNDVIDDVIIWVQDGNCKRWLGRILGLVRSTI